MKLTHLHNIATHLRETFFPRICPTCGAVLGRQEQQLCTACLLDLPLVYPTAPHRNKHDALDDIFAGRIYFRTVAAYIHYNKSSRYSAILHDAKYRQNPTLGQWLAGQAMTQLHGAEFYHGVDCVVPVPLHPDRLAHRGYNQSLYIARGVAWSLQVPVVEALSTRQGRATQTHKTRTMRYESSRQTYTVNQEQLKQIQGKHILLVDDVLTTGSTLLACAQTLHNAGVPSISFFTLGIADT